MVHEYKSGRSYASKVSHPPVCFRTWPRLARTRAPTLRGWSIPYPPMPYVRKLVRFYPFLATPEDFPCDPNTLKLD
jgi:hypothetical protein